MSDTSYRVDETYTKVGKSCKYLYRVAEAKWFFKKMVRVEHRRLPFSISVDENAAYPEAFSVSQAERSKFIQPLVGFFFIYS